MIVFEIMPLTGGEIIVGRSDDCLTTGKMKSIALTAHRASGVTVLVTDAMSKIVMVQNGKVVNVEDIE